MKKVMVVHCKRDKYDVYIGRPSKWGNPFSYKPGTLAKWKAKDRADSIAKYEEYLHESGLINDVHELKDMVLGCWCKPQACHGDILVKYANEKALEGGEK